MTEAVAFGSCVGCEPFLSSFWLAAPWFRGAELVSELRFFSRNCRLIILTLLKRLISSCVAASLSSSERILEQEDEEANSSWLCDFGICTGCSNDPDFFVPRSTLLIGVFNLIAVAVRAVRELGYNMSGGSGSKSSMTRANHMPHAALDIILSNLSTEVNNKSYH